MAKNPPPPAASAGSHMSTARNKEVTCHACGNPGHFKRDCPNRRVMFVNEETGEYETGDDEDPAAYDDEGYNSEQGMDAFPSPTPTIVVSQRALTDEDMATIVTPTTPAKIPTGPITRD